MIFLGTKSDLGHHNIRQVIIRTNSSPITESVFIHYAYTYGLIILIMLNLSICSIVLPVSPL